MSSLEIGKEVPDFTLPDSHSEETSLSQFRGKTVVVYFYPKDNTPGCTSQACNFRDNIETIREENMVILGISPDSPKSHIRFLEKQNLPSREEGYILLSDPDKKVASLFNVYKEKMMFGKKKMGIVRTSFIINGEGILTHIIEKPKVKEHTEQIIACLKG